MEDVVPFANLHLDLLLTWLLSLLSFWFNHLDTNYKLDLNYTSTAEKIYFRNHYIFLIKKFKGVICEFFNFLP